MLIITATLRYVYYYFFVYFESLSASLCFPHYLVIVNGLQQVTANTYCQCVAFLKAQVRASKIF